MKLLSLAVLLFTLSAAAQAEHSDRVVVGGHVDIDDSVAGSVYAAGGHVTVDAPVEGGVRAAGGFVSIGPNALIERNASLAGGQVEVRGTVKGNLRVGAGRVVIDGTVDGDASVASGSLELGPNARIAGKLRYRGEGLERAAGAQVGSVERLERHRHHGDFVAFGHSTGRWVWTVGLMLIAGIVAAALPGFSGRMAEELRTRPWMTLLLGFVALICIPVAAVLIMITIVGIPIGILALLSYALLVIVGYACASVVVGGLLLERFRSEAAQRTAWRAGAAVLTMLAIALLGRLPFVGHAFVLMALVGGVGLVVAALLHLRTPQPAA